MSTFISAVPVEIVRARNGWLALVLLGAVIVIWVESLFLALDAEISEGSGSRVRVALNDLRAVFHRPHPQKETKKATVKSVRRFLQEAGVKS